MPTATVRRLAVPVLAALVLVAGCGGDDDEGAPATSTTTEAASAETSASTTAPDEAAETTTSADPSSTTTTEADGATGSTAPDTAEPGQEGTGAPDEEAPDVTWDLDATRYRGEDGTRVAFLCPPDGEVGAVWGTGTYTDDSSVCSAAVHAGLISTVEGGRVVIEIAPGEGSYEGSEANGVTAADYGAWEGSFTFPRG